MKQFLFLSLLSLLFFSSCKKGQDDPTVSLQSRKARLAGHWVMKSGTTSLTLDAMSRSYKFDGSEVQVFTTPTGGPLIVYFGKYTLSMDFTKDGDFKFDEVIVGTRTKCSGSWSFNEKSDDYKAKELLLLETKNVEIGVVTDSFLMQFAGTCSYKLIRLSKDELVIYNSGTYKNSGGENIKYTSEFHFSKSK